MSNFSNIAVDTNFASSITDSETSKAVDSATGWPEAPFTLQCEDEVILVGTKSGTTFSNMERGFDGTTAAAHTTTPDVVHRGAARHIYGTDTWLDYLFQRPYDETVHTYDDEFDDATISGDWTSVTPAGTATWTEAGSRLHVKNFSQASNDVACQLKSLGSLTAPVTIDTVYTSAGEPGNNAMSGILFSTGTSTSSSGFGMLSYWSGNTDEDFHVFQPRSGTLTNFNGTHGVTSHMRFSGRIYNRVVWIATNSWAVMWSSDGVNWFETASNPISYTMTPTHFGLHATSWGASDPQSSAFEYFRVTESDLS